MDGNIWKVKDDIYPKLELTLTEQKMAYIYFWVEIDQWLVRKSEILVVIVKQGRGQREAPSSMRRGSRLGYIINK